MSEACGSIQRNSLGTFKSRLKTFLFSLAFNRHWLNTCCQHLWVWSYDLTALYIIQICYYYYYYYKRSSYTAWHLYTVGGITQQWWRVAATDRDQIIWRIQDLPKHGTVASTSLLTRLIF